MFGNKNSVKELYGLYSNDVFHYSLSILKDYEDAKDAVQEVFIQYLKKEDDFRGECSYKTWLLTITRNYCFKKLNDKSTRIQKAGQEFPAAYEMNIEANISLHDALEGLSPDEYEIIYLKEIFPEATTYDVFFIFDTSVHKEDRPLLNLSDNNLSMNEISASAKKRPAADSNLYLNVEYVRLNKKGDETFVRSKFKCPPETDNIFSDNESAKPFRLNIYKGSISVPFEMYNPLKKQLFEQSMSYDRDFTYSILAIPLAVKGRTYSMELIIHREIWGGMVSYSKKIELKIGKPMLIELECAGGQSRNNEIIDGQLLRLNFKEDFSDYVKEYFIINYAEH